MNKRITVVLWLLLVLSTGAIAQEVKSLSLEETIRLGLDNSKTLKQAKARIEAAQAKYEQLRALQYPQVKAFAGYSYISPVPELIFPGQTKSLFPYIADNTRAGVSLVQPVSGGFRAMATLQAAELLAKAISLDAEKDQAELKLNLANAYFGLYKLQESKKLVDEHLNTAQKRQKDVQSLFKNGLVAKNELLRAELMVSNMQLAQLDAANALQVANFNLNILLGLSETTLVEVHPVLGGIKATKTYDDYLAEALQNRTELRAADLRIQSAKNTLKVSKASYYPVISLNANYLNANPNPRLIPLQAKWFDTWDAGISLSYDLTALFTTKHQVSEAKTQVYQSTLGADQIKDQVKMEVNQQYITYLQQYQKLEVNRKAVEQASENYRVVKNKFDNQVALLTDVLEADALVLQAKLAEAMVRADAELAYQKLLKSTGNL